MTILKEPISSNKNLHFENRLLLTGKSINITNHNVVLQTESADSLIPINGKIKINKDKDQFLVDNIKVEHLNREQFLNHSFEMEQARSNLIQLLADNTQTLFMLAKEYIFSIEQGLDQSEIFSLSYDNDNKKPEQEKSSVQVTAKQFGLKLRNLLQKILLTADTEKNLWTDYSKQITDIHFLPIFFTARFN